MGMTRKTTFIGGLALIGTAAVFFGHQGFRAPGRPEPSATIDRAVDAIQVTGAPKGIHVHPGEVSIPTYSGDSAAIRALDSGAALGTALVSADLNRDGAPDLIAGYRNGAGGIVVVRPGNPDAYATTDTS